MRLIGVKKSFHLSMGIHAPLAISFFPCLSKEVLLLPLPNPFEFQQRKVISPLHSSIVVKTCMMTFL